MARAVAVAVAVAAATVVVQGDVTVVQWANTALGPAAAGVTHVVPNLNSTAFVPTPYSSARIVGQVVPTAAEFLNFSVVTDGAVRLWIDDMLIIDDEGVDQVRTLAPFFAYPAAQAGMPVPLRLEYTHFTGVSTLVLLWQGNVTAMGPVPAGSLLATVPAAEQQRQAMRDRMYAPAVAWGTYYNPSMGAHVQLPSAFALYTTLVRMDNGSVLGDIIVFRDANPAITTIGPHSYNGSDFTQVTLDAWQGLACTVTLQTTVVMAGGEEAGDRQDLLYLASYNGTDCGKLGLLVLPQMLFGHAGTVVTNATTSTVVATMPGFPSITTYTTAHTIPFPPANTTNYLAIPFTGGAPVGLSTGAPYTVAAMQGAIAAAAERQSASLTRWGDLAGVYDAMSTVIAWNTIFTPYEGVITPVSRGWDFGNGYVLFCWDNVFLAYMAALEAGTLDIAYSNLIQIIQARGADGMVPNYASGLRKSYDRTEPQIGAYVTNEIYRKWGDVWLVEVVFDALLSWNDWVWERRRGEGVLAPVGGNANLVVLGSDPTDPLGDWATNTQQGARYESGLDDSPMYDGVDNGLGPVMFNNVTHHMELYDVGMSALFLADTQALMDLATAINRTDVIPVLQQRLASMTAAVNLYLWDEGAGMFTNMLYNGTLYPRFSPTSFYPMISGAATDEQATAMMAWLTSPYGFCVNATHRGPPGTTMLIQYWDGEHDNAECATPACIKQQVLTRYDFVRVEGLVLVEPPPPLPSPAQQGGGGGQLHASSVDASAAAASLPLYSYYSTAWDDHLMTTLASPPDATYALLRTEGYCKPNYEAGDTNLTLWFSSSRHDYKVCGTQACEQDGGYTYIDTLCYAYNGTGLDNLPCLFGVPSIARSDPAFFDNGYWRGRIWGPHIQLVYWALRRYDHLPIVHDARQVLVAQSKQLLLYNWDMFHHVNENSNGVTGTGELDSSDWFYHWGALAGFISFLEAGLF